MSKKPLVTVTDFTGEHKTPIYHATELESKKVIGKTHIIQDCYIGDVDYSNGVALPILSDTDFGAIGVCLIAPTGERTRIGNTPADNDRLANYSLLANGDYLGNYDPKGVILTNDTALACRIVELDKGVILASDDDLPLLAERLKDFNTPCKWASNTTTAPQWDIECVSLNGYVRASHIHNLFNGELLDLNKIEQDKQALQAVIKELATLDKLGLALVINETAKNYKLSAKDLRLFVAEYKQGDLVKMPKPHSEPVSNEAIYQELYKLIDDFMVIDEPYKVMFVLWVVFSYLVDISEIAPIFWITSPEKQCGKSTLLGLLERVCCKPLTANSISKSAVYRVVESVKPCLMIDEIDANLNAQSDIWGVINGGYNRYANNSIRVDTDNGNSLACFNAYGAKVLCGIGANLPSATISRCIKIVLRRKGKDDRSVNRLNIKTLPYPKTQLIQAKLLRWCDDNRQAVQAVDIDPRTDKRLFGVNDRDFDNWYILLQIASVLGVYETALQACLSLNKQEREMGDNERLLFDVRAILTKTPKMTPSQLLNALTNNKELDWANLNGYGLPMTESQLVKRLKMFGIEKKPVNDKNDRYKGFYLKHLAPIFERYLPAMVIDDDNPFLDNEKT